MDTLIAAIGRGQKDSTGTVYYRTIYSDGQQAYPPTACFCSVVRQRERPDRIHLIGTATSSWAALLEEQGADPDLWFALELATESREAPGADEALLGRLGAALTHSWGVPVSCHALCHRELDDANADAVIARLLSLLPDDGEGRLIIDLTHGFRSLPFLVMSAVQLAASVDPDLLARTHLVYGELTTTPRVGSAGASEPARGVVRSLNTIRSTAEQANALAVFVQTLDGEPLADAIQERAPMLADALRAWSRTLWANLFDQLNERCQQLKRALNKGELAGHPLAPLLTQALKPVLRALQAPQLVERLVALADLHIARRRYGLAIIVLSEAATAIAVSFAVRQDAASSLPQLGLPYDELRVACNMLAESLPPAERQRWQTLFYLRNRLCHGANLIQDVMDVQSQSLRKHAESARSLVVSLWHKLCSGTL